MFLNISTTFQRRILCLDIDFKDSIIMDSLPLALDHPPLLHAWVACSVIALSRSMPYWYEKAIKHYDSAVSGLSRALQAQSETGDKWKRETVILLHLFEVNILSSLCVTNAKPGTGVSIKKRRVCTRQGSPSRSARIVQPKSQRQVSHELSRSIGTGGLYHAYY